MTDLTPNHPAVEAAHSATDEWMDDVQHKLPNDQMVHVLDTAIPHLTADDLRNTPAGRELMAEAWDERHATRPNYSQGHDDDCMGWEDCHCGRYLNPYRKADA